MITNKSGVMIRLQMDELRVMGRATQGVKLINLKANDSIASVAKVPRSEEEAIVALEEGGTPLAVSVDPDASVASTEVSDAPESFDNTENTSED
jgi:DNA gyrase subunit A